MGNPENHQILAELQRIRQQFEQQQERINTIEENLRGTPTYTARKSARLWTKKYGPIAYQQLHTFINKKTTLMWLPFIILPLLYYSTFSSWAPSLFTIILMLAYAISAFCAGVYYKFISLRILGYACYLIGITLFSCVYKCHHLLHPQAWYIMHGMFAYIMLSLVGMWYIINKYKENLSPSERHILRRVLEGAAACTGFMWGATTIILLFDRATEQPSFFMRPFINLATYQQLIRTPLTQFLLIIYYALVAAACLLRDLYRHHSVYKIVGICLLIFSAYNAWILATRLQCPRLGYGLLVCIIAYALFMAQAYRYHNHTKKEQ